MKRLLLLLATISTLTTACGDAGTSAPDSEANPFESYCNVDPEAPGDSLSPQQDKLLVYMRHGARNLDPGSKVPFDDFPSSTCNTPIPPGFKYHERSFRYQDYFFSTQEQGTVDWTPWSNEEELPAGKCRPGWLTPGGWRQTETTGQKMGARWKGSFPGENPTTPWKVRVDDKPRVEETAITFIGEAYKSLGLKTDQVTKLEVWPASAYPLIPANSSQWCKNFYSHDGQATDGLQSAALLLDAGQTVGERWEVVVQYLRLHDPCTATSCIKPGDGLNEWLYEGFYGMATAVCPNTNTGSEGLAALPKEFRDRKFLAAFLSFAPYSQVLPFYIFPEAAAQRLIEILEQDLTAPETPISLNFGHDWGPILPLLGLLEADLGEVPAAYWPSFASTLTIGVKFEEGTGQQEGRVEIDYRGRPLKTPHCRSTDGSDGRCSFSDFRKFLMEMSSPTSIELGSKLCTAPTGLKMLEPIRGRARTTTWAEKFAEMTREPVRELEDWIQNP